MWAPFSERARRTIVLAQEEAQRLGNNYIGTEHILLGIVGEGESSAAEALASFGVTLAKVRTEVEAIVGRGGQIAQQEMVFTPRAKRVIELAFEEARQLNHNYIGTEHLLLGLIRQGEGIGAKVLEALSVDLAALRTKLKAGAGAERVSAFAVREVSPERVGQGSAFTSAAQHALLAAAEETKRLGRISCGTDDLLFGIAHVETSLASQVLAKNGVTAERIHDHLAKPSSEGSAPSEGEIEFSKQTKHCFERAFGETIGFKQRQIGAEHLLLAVLAETGHPGADVLTSLGADFERIRRHLVELLGERNA